MSDIPTSDRPTGDRATTDIPAPDVPRSAGRLFDLLEAVLAEGACNLTSAAASAGLTPTTALRHLRALEARGYLTRDELGLFSAGPTLRRIAAVVHEGGPLDRLVATAQPHLAALAATTGESCYLAVADPTGATYVASAESPHRIRHVGWVGQTVSLDGTAVGAALDKPGELAVRTGAVEADVAAISLALPPLGSIRSAVSVIGPAHRLVGSAQVVAEVELVRTVGSLAGELGLGDHSHRAA
jgi:DNA-binding IclR family transcriptional regulator